MVMRSFGEALGVWIPILSVALVVFVITAQFTSDPLALVGMPVAAIVLTITTGVLE